MRVALGIEILVHILQHVFDTYLLAVADAPHAVEGKSLRHSRLKDEHCRGSRTADEVDTFGVERGDGFGEDAVMPGVHQSDTVRAYEGGTILLAGVENFLLQGSTSLCLFAETSRYNNERAHVLLCSKQLHIVGTPLGSHDEDGQVGGRNLLGIMEHLDALHLVFLGINNTQRAFIAAVQNVAHDSSSGLVRVVRAADDDDALRV